ncbi:hypothetical protein Scep_010440 [Stephania cephalantha]|uniref:Uncharacterized protein n=1 Tax=Stephania cephalantha TaxID=152367 RepID=A0AAP0JVR9_9MAGN
MTTTTTTTMSNTCPRPFCWYNIMSSQWSSRQQPTSTCSRSLQEQAPVPFYRLPRLLRTSLTLRTYPKAHVALDRILGYLASHSVLTCSLSKEGVGGTDGERLYGLQPFCKYLVRDRDGRSLAPGTVMVKPILNSGYVCFSIIDYFIPQSNL